LAQLEVARGELAAPRYMRFGGWPTRQARDRAPTELSQSRLQTVRQSGHSLKHPTRRFD